MTRAPKILIVGAGLGGLAAAQALRLANCEVVVAEQSSELGEVGAGINMSPNAMKVLRDLGLEAGALEAGFLPENHIFRDWRSGRVLSRLRVKEQYQEQFGAPQLSIHRSDLHGLLRRGVEDTILTGARCVAVDGAASGATATFADGKQIEADVIIGADGIKSVVRQSLFGPDKATFTGNVAWRFMVPTSDLPPGLVDPAVTNWLGPGAHVVHYYVRRGEVVNVVAVMESDAWTEESWSHRGTKEDVAAAYAGWNPRLFELFDRADTCFKWGIFDRDPLETWSRGPITLLGDAAHPMLPFLGQGAAMALEDGLTLGLLFDAGGRPAADLLQAYERMRIPRTARAQMGSRARAKENHLRSPLARFRRNLGFKVRKWLNPGATLHKGDWLYSYHPSQSMEPPQADPPA